MEALAETNEGKTERKRVAASVSDEFYKRFNEIAFERGETIASLMKSIITGFIDSYYSDRMVSKTLLRNNSSFGYGRFASRKMIQTYVDDNTRESLKAVSKAESKTASEIVRILCENYVYRYENGLNNTTTAQDAPGMPSETGFRMLIDLA